MMRTGSSCHEGQTVSLPRRASWFDKSEILILLLGLFLILCGAVLTIRHDYRTTLGSWKARLSQAVRQQAWTLRTSLDQSRDDAQLLANFAPTSELLGTNAPKAAALREQAAGLFHDFRNVYDYSALCLFDSKKNVVLQVSSASSPWVNVASTRAFSELFRQAMQTGRYQVREIQTSEQALFLIFAMPVFPNNAAGHSPDEHKPPIGVVSMFDPFAKELLMLLNSKEFHMRTAETILLELHDGETNTSRPRYVTGEAVNRKSSLADTLRKGAEEAVENRATFGEYIDYRGIPVVAAMERISSLESVVILKLNRDEALAEFQRTARIEAFTAGAIALAYLALILVLRGNRVEHRMRGQLRAEHFLNERLETTVAERTRELAQINLELESRVQHRTAELEAANKELAAFSYSVSHDLRAPLRGIDGWGQALLEDYGSQLDEVGRQYLNRVLSETKRMGHLIENMLLLSRLSQDEMHLNPVDLSALAQKITNALRDSNLNRAIRFVIEPHLIVSGDARLLEIALTNLFSNAVKFTSARSSALIEFGKVQQKEETRFFIRDNGAGFDMKYSGILFGPFQRLHKESEFSGTGIGLAIVQRVIARHGGRVWADARVEQGATFWFTLGAVAE